jgi:hypothetical protein
MQTAKCRLQSARCLTLLSLVCCILPAVLSAQNYRCDWNVVGIGGGDMSSASYRAGTTIGQTAVGFITSTSYQGFIGFWQIDTVSTGISEDAHWSATEPLVTMLGAPYPNPCPGQATIRYSLASASRVDIRLFDLSGRASSTLVSSAQPAGRYSLHLDAQRLADGIYFLKMRTPDYQATRKLVIR